MSLPIVFLNPWDRVIGPNRYLVEMLRRCPRLAARATVALSEPNDAAEEIRGLGCRAEVWPEIGLLRAGLSSRRLLALAGAHSFGLLRLVGRLRSLRPSLLISNTENLWLGGMAGRMLGVPHVQIFHAMGVFDRFGPQSLLLSSYLRLLRLGSDRWIAVSEAQAAALRRAGAPASQIATVPNPIPVAELERRAAEPAPEVDAELAGHTPILLCAGRLGPRKGQDLLVEALAEIRRAFPGVLCCFAGRPESSTGEVGTFRRRLDDRVAELGLGDHVRFLGEVLKLPAWLRRADLCVQPSRSESFGRVVAEALVCGAPVVAFEVGGIPEVAGPGAVLVPPGDAAALARAVVERLRAPEEARRAASRGRAHVVERFAAERVAALFERTLSEVTREVTTSPPGSEGTDAAERP